MRLELSRSYVDSNDGTWVCCGRDGSTGLNLCLIVLDVKAKLSLVLIEEQDQLKPLSTVYQLTDYSTVRHILRF
jgi:hypothetical protein